MTIRIAIIPNEDYLTKELVIQLAATFPKFEWFILDVDRNDLKTEFRLTSKEAAMFVGIEVNSQYGNELFLKKQTWINNQIRKIQPDIVFTFSAANFSYRCIRKAFPNQQIYVLQTALLRSEPQSSLIQRFRKKIYNFFKMAPVYAPNSGFFQPNEKTMFGVWSESVIPPFLKNKIKFRVVGNYNIDSALASYKRPTQRVVEYPFKVIYMTQPISHYFGMESHDKNIQVIEQILASNTGLQMTIKIHPRENKELYLGLASAHPDCVNWAEPDTELNSLLEGQDILLTHYSTTIDTAVAMNIPVVCIDPEGKFKNYLPLAGVYVKVITKGADLDLSSAYFHNAQEREKERKLYLSVVTGYPEGNSLQRIGESLMTFANSAN